MSKNSRRLPTNYLEGVLPTINNMIGQREQGGEEFKKEREGRMRKVHFYVDSEDYEKIESIVSKLANEQEIWGDRRGLFSKILRMSVKLGLREVEARFYRTNDLTSD